MWSQQWRTPKSIRLQMQQRAVVHRVWFLVVDKVLRPFYFFRRTLPHLSVSVPSPGEANIAPVADNFLSSSPQLQLTSHTSFHSADFAISYCRILAPTTFQQFQTKHDVLSLKRSSLSPVPTEPSTIMSYGGGYGGRGGGGDRGYSNGYENSNSGYSGSAYYTSSHHASYG